LKKRAQPTEPAESAESSYAGYSHQLVQAKAFAQYSF